MFVVGGGGDEEHRLRDGLLVPDELALEAIRQALERGVRVHVIMPGPIIDAALVRRGSRVTLQSMTGWQICRPTCWLIA